MTQEGQANQECTSRCPICRLLWPGSTAGKLIVLVVLLVVAGAVLAWQLLRTDIDGLMRRGMRLYEAGRLDAAAETFDEVLRRDPNRPLALDYLGLIALKSHDVEKAIRYRKMAAEMDPLSPQHFWNLAHIYFFVKKDYSACEEPLRRAMSLAPKAQYHLLYALCAVERKLDRRVIIDRLKNTVRVGVNQANSMKPEDLEPQSSLSKVLAEAAKRLASYGDDYGYDRLQQLATEARTKEVRAFAARLLADRQGR